MGNDPELVVEVPVAEILPVIMGNLGVLMTHLKETMVAEVVELQTIIQE